MGDLSGGGDGDPSAFHPRGADVVLNVAVLYGRLLLNRHVRYYGDEVAVVVAEDEVAAAQAARLVKVDYDEYPFADLALTYAFAHRASASDLLDDGRIW